MDSCPKCGTARGVGPSCKKCGLAVDRWSSFSHAPVASNPALDDAFTALDARWDEPSAHDQFIALARSLDALDGAASRYSQRLRDRADDEVARRALARLTLLAQHAQQNAPRDPLKGTRLVFVVSSALAAGMVFVVALLIWRVLISRH